MTDLEEAESTLLRKLCGELREGVLQLGEPAYDSPSAARMPLGRFTFRLAVPAVAVPPSRAIRFVTYNYRLQATLWDGEQKVAEFDWLKTEESVTKVLGLVRSLVTKFLA